MFGCGALGSTLMSIISNYSCNVDKFVLIDDDVVEDRNITPGTQFFTRDQIGKSKVEALQTNLYLFSGLTNTEIVKKRIDYKNIKELGIVGNDLLIDCFDNAESRELVADYGFHNMKPVLHSAFSFQKTFDIWWDDTQEIQDPIAEGDICEMMGAGGFVRMVGGLTAEVYNIFINSQEKKSVFGSMRKIVWM